MRLNDFILYFTQNQNNVLDYKDCFVGSVLDKKSTQKCIFILCNAHNTFCVGQFCTKQTYQHRMHLFEMASDFVSTKEQIRTKNTITCPNFLYMPICLLQAQNIWKYIVKIAIQLSLFFSQKCIKVNYKLKDKDRRKI